MYVRSYVALRLILSDALRVICTYIGPSMLMAWFYVYVCVCILLL